MVIAIIAVLASLLLPVLAKAKDQAWKIQCINNEKQLIVAWNLYSADNLESLAPNGGGAAGTSAFLWVQGSNHGDQQTLVNTQYLVSARYALFAPYIRSVSIYKCPADRLSWTIGGKRVSELRSYSMNSYVGTGPKNAQEPISLNPAYRIYLKSSALASDLPAMRHLFIDVNPSSICTPGFGVEMLIDNFIHYPSALHRGMGVVSYADGHAEPHKWLDARTRKTANVAGDHIPHEDPSPNNPDIRWIRERTTRK